MNRIIPLLFCLLSTAIQADPIVIDDRAIGTALRNEITKYAESDDGPTADELRELVAKAPAKYDQKINFQDHEGSPDESVYLISSSYLCGKCSKWHPGGTATAWALSSDGLMVTNYHVFEKTKGGAMGVCGINGQTHRVIEIVAADQANDIAIFRVDAKELKPLRLGAPAPVGESIEVISHPESRFFSHTFGRVSRYHKVPARGQKKQSTQMSITADYAKGSSGGPVLDSNKHVVGMVSSTQSIYYESSRGQEPKGPLQMVVKNCIPVAAISAMLETSPKEEE